MVGETTCKRMNVRIVIWLVLAPLGVSFEGSLLSAADSPSLSTRTFTSGSPIQIVDDGPAVPYPSSITVSGMTGQVFQLSVALRGLVHYFPDDLDIVLVSPENEKLVLMSDAGGSFPVDGADITFADGFPVIPNSGPLVTQTYSPANWGLGADTFPIPAPTGPLLVGFTNLLGSSPNGVWKLFVFDDTAINDGSIDLGWSLTVTTVAPVANLRLSILRQTRNQTAQISWSSLAYGYKLYSAPIPFFSNSSWTPVTNTVATTNGENRVIVSVDRSNQFFKLIWQGLPSP